MFSILPFEVDFYEKKHHYPIHYVGNPTAQEVREYMESSGSARDSERPVIALLAGSRKQEIKDNLPAMIAATRHLATDYDIVLAGAPSIEPVYYQQFLQDSAVRLVINETYKLLSQATAALVTSGTATLETAMFRVPQVVCYETPIPTVIAFLKKHIIKVKYISLVNLIADREVVPELVADTFSIENIRQHLESILPGGTERQAMLDGYEEVHRRLGDSHAPDVAAQQIYKLLSNNQNI
jgi:lipid-A-disaccharide synthase